MSGDHLINIVAFYSEPGMAGTIYSGNIVEERPQQEMLDRFEGWEPEVLQLLQVSCVWENRGIQIIEQASNNSQCVEQPSRWAINNLKGLPTYIHGRVAVLGDAVC